MVAHVFSFWDDTREIAIILVGARSSSFDSHYGKPSKYFFSYMLKEKSVTAMPHSISSGFAKKFLQKLRSLVRNENNNSIFPIKQSGMRRRFSSKYLSNVHGLFLPEPTSATSSYNSVLLHSRQAFNFPFSPVR